MVEATHFKSSRDSSSSRCVVHWFSVEDLLEAPEFIQAPQSVQLVKGEAIALSCKAKGKPMPKITWLKDGVKLKKGRLLLLSLLENKDKREVDSEVQLQEVTPALTQGNYTIEAENKAGKAVHNLEIIGEHCSKKFLMAGPAEDFVCSVYLFIQ